MSGWCSGKTFGGEFIKNSGFKSACRQTLKKIMNMLDLCISKAFPSEFKKYPCSNPAYFTVNIKIKLSN